jgi:hypothetical protein
MMKSKSRLKNGALKDKIFINGDIKNLWTSLDSFSFKRIGQYN